MLDTSPARSLGSVGAAALVSDLWHSDFGFASEYVLWFSNIKDAELRGRRFAEHEAAGVDGGHDFDFANGR